MANIIKGIKFFYYIKGYGRSLLGKRNLDKKLNLLYSLVTDEQKECILQRVNYYNKLESWNHGIMESLNHNLRLPHSPRTYYIDTYEYSRFFSEDLPICYEFGDVTHIPKVPSIVKSRPIRSDNCNSVLLNLDKHRHFVWVNGDKPFKSKKDQLIGRGGVHQPHRIKFYELYFNHPLCDLGHVKNNKDHQDWFKPKISIEAHLDYKFILALEGNDVASNLKWVMSSNSIAVMPKPKFETWFMEGKLVGGKHYIEIKDDYSDLEDKLNYYINNPQECEAILKNAHQFCEQFFDPVVEDLCSLLVLKKYFNQ